MEDNLFSAGSRGSPFLVFPGGAPSPFSFSFPLPAQKKMESIRAAFPPPPQEKHQRFPPSPHLPGDLSPSLVPIAALPLLSSSLFLLIRWWSLMNRVEVSAFLSSSFDRLISKREDGLGPYFSLFAHGPSPSSFFLWTAVVRCSSPNCRVWFFFEMPTPSFSLGFRKTRCRQPPVLRKIPAERDEPSVPFLSFLSGKWTAKLVGAWFFILFAGVWSRATLSPLRPTTDNDQIAATDSFL